MRDFTKYVHEYESRGKTRYAVGEWQQEQAQYHVPHDRQTGLLTGCSASFSRSLARLPDTYDSRKKALRRARYLYYEMDAEYHDLVEEDRRWRAELSEGEQ